MVVLAAERHILQANLPAWRMLKNLQVRAQEDASEALYKKLADKMAQAAFAVNTAGKARAMGFPSALADHIVSRVRAEELRASISVSFRTPSSLLVDQPAQPRARPAATAAAATVAGCKTSLGGKLEGCLCGAVVQTATGHCGVCPVVAKAAGFDRRMREEGEAEEPDVTAIGNEKLEYMAALSPQVAGLVDRFSAKNGTVAAA